MRIGDTIRITREDFIRLAPLGLMIYNPQTRSTFYYCRSRAACHTARHREIPGYVYSPGRHDTPQTLSSDHLRGYWDDIAVRAWVVTRLPNTYIYRRSACELV